MVNSLLLLHLLDGLLHGLDLLDFLGVGNHDGLLDLTGLSLLSGLHDKLDVVPVDGLLGAFLDSVVNLLVLSAGAREVVGAAAVTLESGGDGFDGLGLRGDAEKSKCEELNMEESG